MRDTERILTLSEGIHPGREQSVACKWPKRGDLRVFTGSSGQDRGVDSCVFRLPLAGLGRSKPAAHLSSSEFRAMLCCCSLGPSLRSGLGMEEPARPGGVVLP